jgi:putative FmdB family regulatory protein
LPLYEYQCVSCGQAVDKRHGFDESMTDRCEHCGGELKRTFSAAGIVFKGSGFYVTDSRKSSGASSSSSSSEKKTETSSESKSESTESKSETKTESKPETKTDAKKGEAAA